MLPVRRVVLAVGLLAAVTACGGGGAPSAAVTPGRWVVLGSSTAAGVGAPAGQGWVDLLAADAQPLGVTVTNLARSGLQSSQALPTGAPLPPGRPPPDPGAGIDRALAEGPTLVLLSFPSNDAVAGVPAADTVQAWQVMRMRARSAGAVTLVLSTQPRAGLTPAQHAAQLEVDRLAGERFGECFVPLRAALAGPDGAVSPAYAAGDGIHLNAAGHRRVYERLWSVLTGGACVSLGAGAR